MARKVSWKFTGMADVKRRLEMLAKQYPQAAMDSLYEEGEAIMTLAKKKCPVLTGRLMNTGYVHPPSGMEVEMGFGTDYGIYVHERTELNHPNGEAKFFENAINERVSGFPERMARRIQGKVGIA